MTVAPTTRADRIIPGGAGLILPGLVHLPAGAPVFMHNFGGLIDGVNAVAAQGALLVPFRAKIIYAKIRVRVQMGTGPAVIDLGSTADTDRFISQSVPISAAAGVVYEFIDDDDFATSRIIEADSVIIATGDGGATSTGSVDAMILYAPAPA